MPNSKIDFIDVSLSDKTEKFIDNKTDIWKKIGWTKHFFKKTQ